MNGHTKIEHDPQSQPPVQKHAPKEQLPYRYSERRSKMSILVGNGIAKYSLSRSAKVMRVKQLGVKWIRTLFINTIPYITTT